MSPPRHRGQEVPGQPNFCLFLVAAEETVWQVVVILPRSEAGSFVL